MWGVYILRSIRVYVKYTRTFTSIYGCVDDSTVSFRSMNYICRKFVRGNFSESSKEYEYFLG